MKRSSLWTGSERAELTEPLLTLDNLVIGYQEPLTEPISLEVGRGEVIAILGPSGVGKTTICVNSVPVKESMGKMG